MPNTQPGQPGFQSNHGSQSPLVSSAARSVAPSSTTTRPPSGSTNRPPSSKSSNNSNHNNNTDKGYANGNDDAFRPGEGEREEEGGGGGSALKANFNIPPDVARRGEEEYVFREDEMLLQDIRAKQSRRLREEREREINNSEKLVRYVILCLVF